MQFSHSAVSIQQWMRGNLAALEIKRKHWQGISKYVLFTALVWNYSTGKCTHGWWGQALWLAANHLSFLLSEGSRYFCAPPQLTWYHGHQGNEIMCVKVVSVAASDTSLNISLFKEKKFILKRRISNIFWLGKDSDCCFVFFTRAGRQMDQLIGTFAW